MKPSRRKGSLPLALYILARGLSLRHGEKILPGGEAVRSSHEAIPEGKPKPPWSRGK